MIRQPSYRTFSRKRINRNEFAKAQNFVCPLCDKRLFTQSQRPDRIGSFDHVIPKSKGGKDFGNLLCAHRVCNELKRANDPSQKELEMLEQVNSVLGWNGVFYAKTAKGQKLVRDYLWIKENKPDIFEKWYAKLGELGREPI